MYHLRIDYEDVASLHETFPTPAHAVRMLALLRDGYPGATGEVTRECDECGAEHLCDERSGKPLQACDECGECLRDEPNRDRCAACDEAWA